MDSEKKDFFISYTGNDVQSAEWIAVTLENAGYTTIIQEWDFKPGENFVINMHDALINTKRFIAVLSSDYFDSYYCRAEFSAAFTKDSGSEKGLLIPVLISDIQVEGLFAPVIYIDLYGIEDEEAKKRLLLGVDNQSRPRNRPSRPGTKKKDSQKACHSTTYPASETLFLLEERNS